MFSFSLSLACEAFDESASEPAAATVAAAGALGTLEVAEGEDRLRVNIADPLRGEAKVHKTARNHIVR